MSGGWGRRAASATAGTLLAGRAGRAGPDHPQRLAGTDHLPGGYPASARGRRGPGDEQRPRHRADRGQGLDLGHSRSGRAADPRDGGLRVGPTTPSRPSARMGDVVVKPLFGSMGLGMTRVSDEDMAWRVFRVVETIRGVYYLQRFVPHEGRDVRAFVVGGPGARRHRAQRARLAHQLLARRKRAPFTLPARVGRPRGARGRRRSGAEYAGVDLLPANDGTVYVLEVNGIPGWEGLQQATGIDVAGAVVDQLLEYLGPSSGYWGAHSVLAHSAPGTIHDAPTPPDLSSPRHRCLPPRGQRGRSPAMSHPGGHSVTCVTRISWPARSPSGPELGRAGSRPLGRDHPRGRPGNAALDAGQHQSGHHPAAHAPGAGGGSARRLGGSATERLTGAPWRHRREGVRRPARLSGGGTGRVA